MNRAISNTFVIVAIAVPHLKCGDPVRKEEQKKSAKPASVQAPIQSSSEEQTILKNVDDENVEVNNAMDRLFLAMSADATSKDDGSSSANSSPNDASSTKDANNADKPVPSVDGIGSIIDSLFKLNETIVAQILKIFDADKNGKVSKAELLSLIMAKQERFLSKFSSVVQARCSDKDDQDLSKRCDNLLKKYDADKDGKLSESEIEAIEKDKLEKMALKREDWVLSMASRICMNNPGICDDDLKAEVQIRSVDKAKDQNKYKSDIEILARLNKLVEKFLKKFVKEERQKKNDSKDAEQVKDDQKK